MTATVEESLQLYNRIKSALFVVTCCRQIRVPITHRFLDMQNGNMWRHITELQSWHATLDDRKTHRVPSALQFRGVKLGTWKHMKCFCIFLFFKIHRAGRIETPERAGFGPRAICLEPPPRVSDWRWTSLTCSVHVITPSFTECNNCYLFIHSQRRVMTRVPAIGAFLY